MEIVKDKPKSVILLIDYNLILCNVMISDNIIERIFVIWKQDLQVMSKQVEKLRTSWLNRGVYE